MVTSWYRDIDVRFVLLGAVAALGLSSVWAILLAFLNLSHLWMLLLFLTLLSISIGGMVGAWRTRARTSGIVNGAVVALICIFVSLLVSANTQALQSNLLGFLFLIVSYGAAGVLGGMAREWVLGRLGHMRA